MNDEQKLPDSSKEPFAELRDLRNVLDRIPFEVAKMVLGSEGYPGEGSYARLAADADKGEVSVTVEVRVPSELVEPFLERMRRA